MTLLFLTACLEPGRDGVGDYTRRLAAACVRQGHTCHLLALNDSQVTAPSEKMEEIEGSSVRVLRLPANFTWPRRIELAQAFRSQFPVDRISLQFVAYGFSPRGFARRLADHLAPIVADTPLHLMLHELWIGNSPEDSLKQRLVGKLQRRYLRQMIRQLCPRWINTSNPVYAALLEKMQFASQMLPLFGNIPVEPSDSVSPLPPALADLRNASPSPLRGLFFGTLPPEWRPEPFFSILLVAAKKRSCRPRLIAAGRLGQRGEFIWQQLQRDYGDRIDFVTLGELASPAISILLQEVDFGVASSPWLLLGKSGSVAAMLDHGLPVIVTRDDFQPGFASPRPIGPLLHACDEALEEKLIAGLPKASPRERLPEIAGKFLQELA